MHIGFYNRYNIYNKNKMLQDPSSIIGDNLMYPFFYLAKKLNNLGHTASTIDTDDLAKFDTVVFVELPGRSNTYINKLISLKKPIYLIALESPIIAPENYDKKNHNYFKKIFTWDDSLVDNKKYFKINYSHRIPDQINLSSSSKEKLCTIISGNKVVSHPLELYTERIRAIRWFEKNHPEDFDLYGKGWDEYNFQGKIFGFNIARFNRLKLITKLLKPTYPSYKGQVKSKKETYNKYKFALCYENVRDFSGYITEKIFDCFFGSCVPIYWGANNIEQYIPKETFIDKRNFKTYEELYLYIKNMKDEDYLKYLSAISDFLQSNKAYPYSAEYFSETIIREVTS